MRNKLVVLSSAIAVAALVAGVAIPAAGSSGQAGQHGAFRVTATVTEESQIDLGAPGPSLGDEIVFSGPLLQGGHQVGHQGAVGSTVSLQRHEAQFIATYSFGGGQITAQALVILGSAAPYDVAITGGTGKYQGAKGEIHVIPATPTNPNGILTFHLED
ncbi:MAG TPA: hypothetical protein VF221_04315 [Chloroflexota bacterium]